MNFELKANYQPSGDQPKAIKKLLLGLNQGKKHQVLLGATGTGKTFTISNVIKELNKPVLVLAHNKTLAGQLYSEFKELFPNNKVEYFVSYYDYYQPEAYVPATDTYIEKDASINDEIDELRHSTTSSLINRRDVIVVASVSCIYGIGEIKDYKEKMLILNVGDTINRDQILTKLIEMLYERNNIDLKRGTFRVRGDVVEIIPSYERQNGIRIEFFGNEIERLREFNVLTGAIISNKKTITIYPASHFVTNEAKLEEAIRRIEQERNQRLKELKDNHLLLEHQRLLERTNFDLEMLKETGFCHGIENYARHLALREEGETPTTLLDYFNNDFLLVIDESHVTLPQVRGMYNGDRARKQSLVDYGFRLPSALDNRPLKFSEFENKLPQVIYVSATPGDYELKKVNYQVVEQIIRPTGLLDPEIEIRSREGQIDDLISEINKRILANERTLITTLTIRMAEELTDYLKGFDIKVAYLHNEIKTLERISIIRDLRLGVYDVLVGINLLREGLDLPEVSLIAILDADKQGFLRSERSLIQTIGRCARNVNGKVLMYADKMSDSMKVAINETNRRRQKQKKYNEQNNIIPKTIIKEIRDLITNQEQEQEINSSKIYSEKDREVVIKRITKEMNKAASNLEFERATELRDILFELKAN